MKTILIGIFLFLSIIGRAQQEEEVNVFQQSENQITGVTSKSPIDGEDINAAQGPGNPPGDDEIPIDQYLPLLFIMANALLVYKFKSKKANIKS